MKSHRNVHAHAHLITGWMAMGLARMRASLPSPRVRMCAHARARAHGARTVRTCARRFCDARGARARHRLVLLRGRALLRRGARCGRGVERQLLPRLREPHLKRGITRDYTPFLLILQGMTLQLQGITLPPF